MSDFENIKTNQTVQLAIINLIAEVGLDAAVSIIKGLKSAATIDDAIAALEATQKKTWEDYKKEAAGS